MWRRAVKDRTWDDSDLMEIMQAAMSEFFAKRTLHIRSVGDDSSSQDLPPDFFHPLDDSSLDSDVKMQLQALDGHAPGIQVRKVDPLLFDQITQGLASEGTGLARARHPAHAGLGAGAFGKAAHCTVKNRQLELAVADLRQSWNISQTREVEILNELRPSSTSQTREVELLNELRRGSFVQLPPWALVPGLCGGEMPGDAALLAAVVSTPVVDLPPVKLGDLGLAPELASRVMQCTGMRLHIPILNDVPWPGHLVELPKVPKACCGPGFGLMTKCIEGPCIARLLLDGSTRSIAVLVELQSAAVHGQSKPLLCVVTFAA